MTKGTDNLDEFAISEHLEDGEHFEFVKPLYTRGWFIGLLWLVLLPVGLYVWFPYVLQMLLFQLAYLSIIVITLIKFFRSPRKLTIYGDVVKVYTFKNDPAAEFRFSKMTCIVDDEEIFLIKKRSFIGGIVLRRVYWMSDFAVMRRVFRGKSSYVKKGIYEDMGLPGPEKFLWNQGAFGGGALIALPLLFDYFMLPYLIVCKLVFKR